MSLKIIRVIKIVIVGTVLLTGIVSFMKFSGVKGKSDEVASASEGRVKNP